MSSPWKDRAGADSRVGSRAGSWGAGALLQMHTRKATPRRPEETADTAERRDPERKLLFNGHAQVEVREEPAERRKGTAVPLRSGKLGARDDLLTGGQSSCSASRPIDVVKCRGQFRPLGLHGRFM